MRSRPTLLLSLLAATALAQTAAIGGADPSRGTTLLPGSSAWSDEATSLVYNPAGLGRVGRVNAWYVHERSNVRPQDNDGLWLATSLGDLVGLGVSFQWLRPAAGPGGRPGQVVAGLLRGAAGVLCRRDGELVLQQQRAVGHHPRRGPAVPAAALAVVRRLRAQPQRAEGQPAGPRTPSSRGSGRWAWGCGPSASGSPWASTGSPPEGISLGRSRLQYTVQAHFLGGVRLMAGVSHSFVAGEPLYFHAGLGLDLENVGYTQGVAYANGQLELAVRRPLLDGQVRQRRPAAEDRGDLAWPISARPAAPPSARCWAWPAKIATCASSASSSAPRRIPSSRALVLKVEGAGVGLARADEVRDGDRQAARGGQEGLRLRALGRRPRVPDDLWLRRHLRRARGDAADRRAALERHLLRRHRASASASTSTWRGSARTRPSPSSSPGMDMSDAQRETINAYLDTNVKTVAARIQAARGIEPAAWQAALDEGPQAGPPRGGAAADRRRAARRSSSTSSSRSSSPARACRAATGPSTPATSAGASSGRSR